MKAKETDNIPNEDMEALASAWVKAVAGAGFPPGFDGTAQINGTNQCTNQWGQTPLIGVIVFKS